MRSACGGKESWRNGGGVVVEGGGGVGGWVCMYEICKCRVSCKTLCYLTGDLFSRNYGTDSGLESLTDWYQNRLDEPFPKVDGGCWVA